MSASVTVVGLRNAPVECFNCGRIFKQILAAVPRRGALTGVCPACRGRNRAPLVTPRRAALKGIFFPSGGAPIP